MELAIGIKAPDFSLPSTKGEFQLYKDAQDELCILYFYPRDFTAGCTKEACGFRDEFSFFRDLDIKIIGISSDSVERHLEFKAKYNLPFELLSDTKSRVAEMYNARMPIFNMSKRISYLLDHKQIIRGIYSNFFDGPAHIREMKEMIENLVQTK
jgi:peroxiredoxin Q/BCP